jgi:hypothetical protein
MSKCFLDSSSPYFDLDDVHAPAGAWRRQRRARAHIRVLVAVEPVVARGQRILLSNAVVVTS